jgi:outer membrane protein assembly factor BamB
MLKKNKKPTKTSRNKTVLFTAALVLMLTFSTIMLNMPAANASGQQATYAFIVAAPHPIGVNQQVFIDFWLAEVSPTAAQSFGDRFSGFTVTITKPDGTKETKGPFSTNDLSSNYFSYVPTKTGNYTFTVNYPGQYFASVDTNYLPSNASYVLTVQQEPVLITPLTLPAQPGDYWTRPINGQNYDWSVLGSNWLMAGFDTTGRSFDAGNAIAPLNKGPDSAHVLWTKSMYFGGIIGEQYGDSAFFSGLSYEQYFKPPVIIAGRLYYNTILAGDAHSIVNFTSITAVDLYTGETLFTIPNATLSFGQIYNYNSPNEAGARAFLWYTAGSTWKMYDAFTGTYLLTYSNVPSGSPVFSSDGSILIYSFVRNTTTQKGNVIVWNSTRVIPHPFITATNDEWTWSLYNCYGNTLDARGTTRIINSQMGDKTLSTNGTEPRIVATVDLRTMPVGATSLSGMGTNRMIAQNGSVSLLAFMGSGTIPVVINNNTSPGVSWYSTYDSQGNLKTGPTKLDLNGIVPPNSTVYAKGVTPAGITPLFIKNTMQWYGFSILTGEKVWGPTEPYKEPFGMYDFQGGFQVVVDGILYNAGYDGYIHAFNVTNGQLLWEFTTGDAGTLLPYGTWPFYNGATFADGKLYAVTGDHGNGVSTLYSGEGLYALDMKTGKLIWNASGWFEHGPVADGLLLSHNNYDNKIYTFGKGPSAITVTAPDVAVTKGQSVMIRGSVTDQSPGAKQLVQEGKFSSVPAISDADQMPWMAYYYSQQQKPASGKGVPVTLTAIDSSGVSQDIGTVTSDTHGNYGFMWTPQTPGQYSIVATFAGSASYGSSQASTYIGVTEAPSASVQPTATPTSPTTSPSSTVLPSIAPPSNPSPSTELYLIAVTAAIVIAIVAAAVVLRRRAK